MLCGDAWNGRPFASNEFWRLTGSSRTRRKVGRYFSGWPTPRLSHPCWYPDECFDTTGPCPLLEGQPRCVCQEPWGHDKYRSYHHRASTPKLHGFILKVQPNQDEWIGPRENFIRHQQRYILLYCHAIWAEVSKVSRKNVQATNWLKHWSICRWHDSVEYHGKSSPTGPSRDVRDISALQHEA